MSGLGDAWHRPLTFDDLTYVCLNMRAVDAREIFACRWDDDRAELAAQTMRAVRLCGRAWCVGKERPVAVLGAVQVWPSRWAAFQFATDEWSRVALAATRFALREAMPLIASLGARRCEVRSADWRHDAHRWLEALGATREAVHPNDGRDGSAYVTYAWIRDDVHLQCSNTAAASTAPSPAVA